MIRNVKLFVVAVLLISAALEADAQKPQTIFNLEENMRKEAALPEAVIAVLKSDEIVDACFREKAAAGAAIKEAEWFAASEIDLNGDRRPDLIVKAADACLFGANQAPFWVFQNAPDGYQKVLSASGLQLEVTAKKSDSFNQIKISKVIAMKPSSEIYGFRAGKYRIVRHGK